MERQFPQMRWFGLLCQEYLHGKAAHGAVRQGHRGQWRIQPRGELDLVVETRHRDIVGYAKARAGKRGLDFHRHAVIAAQDGIRLLAGC